MVNIDISGKETLIENKMHPRQYSQLCTLNIYTITSGLSGKV